MPGVKKSGSVTLAIGQRNTRKGLDATHADFTSAIKREFQRFQQEIQNMMDLFQGQLSEDIMVDALAPTFEQSQVYCPIKTGRLRDSGYVYPNGDPKKPHVEIGYGYGGDPDYCVFVHEMIDVKHEAPTQAKFLQKAVTEDMEFIWLRLVKGYQDAFNGR